MPNKNIAADYRFNNHSPNNFPRTLPPNGKVITYKGAYISIAYFCDTDICNYCYARSQQIKSSMNLGDFRKALGWLKDVSDMAEVYLVGGEPTAIPNLCDYLDVISEFEMKGTLYTNGAFGPRRCQSYSAHPGIDKIAFHYEPLFFSTYRDFRERWLDNIEALSKTKECSLIYVIGSEDFDYEDPLAIATQYNLQLTWVFAAPTSGGTPFMGLNAMRRSGPRIEQFLMEALAQKVRTAPDLAIPLCIFSKEFLETYKNELHLVKRCQPFVYFKPDLSVQFCTALPIYTASPPADSEELKGIIKSHREIDVDLKQRPSFPECQDCEFHLRQICQGGCMTYKVYGSKKAT